MFRRLRELLYDIYIEAMEPPEKRNTPTVQVDCPLHGKTFLYLTRQTACCASYQWVPSGKVQTRTISGRASEVVFR